MNVFLSWSGKRSHMVAKAFYDELPVILDNLTFYLSSSMDKGIRWNDKLRKELAEADFAILCMTRENLSSPWIMYEAGVLSQTAGENYVAPFLLDIDSPKWHGGPLTAFQMTVFDKDDLKKLVFSMNQRCADAERVKESILGRRFESVYNSSLERRLNEAAQFVDEGDEEDIARKTLAGVQRLLDLSVENQSLLREIQSGFAGNP